MESTVFKAFEQCIINAVEEQNSKNKDKNDDHDKPTLENKNSSSSSKNISQEKIKHQGKLIVDATVVEQAIRYPTDLSLLNEAREKTEQLIDNLYPQSDYQKKPRTYREKARKQYLAIVKRRRPGAKLYRKGNKQQLQYLKRNLGYIDGLLDNITLSPVKNGKGQHHKDLFDEKPKPFPLKAKQLRQLCVIKELVAQQQQMHNTKTRRCDDRIVSISQPHVRPIIRGKQNKAVEFGAKLSVSLNGSGIACVDELRWNSFHEGKDLITPVES